MSKRANWLAVACVRKPHGLQGFCKITSYSGDYSHIKKAKQVKVVTKTSEEFYTIEAFSQLGTQFLIKFKGIDVPEVAKKLNGADIYLKREELIPCREGEFYRADLIGACLIFDEKECGVVSALIEGGANDLLEVSLFAPQSNTLSGKKVLVPFIKSVIGHIDIDEKKIQLLEDWFLQ